MIGLSGGHCWEVSEDEASRIQERLAGLVRRDGPGPAVRLVAGADCAYSAGGRSCVAAIAVWDLESRSVVETRTVAAEARFPYRSGLLAFREAPLILAALRLTSTNPQVLICDGHGLAHPRRFGLACHVGLLADIPTIGCAKRLLCGGHGALAEPRGSRVDLVDRGEVVGALLRTRTGVRPLYVSIGHRIDLESAVRIILASTGRYRLPEPLRAAHRLAVC